VNSQNQSSSIAFDNSVDLYPQSINRTNQKVSLKIIFKNDSYNSVRVTSKLQHGMIIPIQNSYNCTRAVESQNHLKKSPKSSKGVQRLCKKRYAKKGMQKKVCKKGIQNKVCKRYAMCMQKKVGKKRCAEKGM
jgi:hypothetical protein